MKPTKLKWLIWSMEHRKWWAENSCGYTDLRSFAGRYSFDDACEIIKHSQCAPETLNHPKEAMIPELP